MSTQLSAIILKRDAANIKTLEDLVTKNAQAGNQSDKIQYLILENGSTQSLLSITTDTVGKSINEAAKVNGNNSLVKTYREGIIQVKEAVAGAGLALLAESYVSEYIVGRECNLTMLPDIRGIYPRDYAIVLPKDSIYLDKFNKAIDELKTDGTIDLLKKKYWINRCQ